jgi:glycosyltransferase involved in cell wall biosynthesis
VISREDFQSVIKDHAIPPVAHDPLAAVAASDPADGWPGTARRPRLGFACHWETARERTWSGSAWNIHEALQLKAEVIDIGVQVPPCFRAALKAVHTRYYGGRLTTTWVYSRLTDRYMQRALHRELSRGIGRECEAAVVIDDLATLPVPFFTYYDSSWDLLLSAVESAEALASLRAITPSIVRQRRDRQLAVYQEAAGVIAFSRWHARSLVEQSGVPAEKVHVALPAVKGRLDDSEAGEGSERTLMRPVPQREGPRRRLLFVGRQHQSYDFYRKGGDLAVGALAILRREYDPSITLTIVGVDKWPLPGEPPDGVSLLGILPAEEVMALYDSHDLFVMPSRFEPFGLVFAEAIARGLPCIARNACAMPEIVTPGLSGALVNGDDERELAGVIAATLSDDRLYENCAARAYAFAHYFSWERTAEDVIQAMSQCFSSAAAPV